MGGSKKSTSAPNLFCSFLTSANTLPRSRQRNHSSLAPCSQLNSGSIQMLSQTVEYSLRAIVWLASHPDDPQTNQQIANATLVPAGYLSKVMQSLGRGGLVTAQRGKRGGFLLARPAGELSVLEVINTVEPIQRIRECPLGMAAHGARLCRLHKRLDPPLSMIA